jgi:formamidopyrimidine-DNA glycosylase
MPELPEVEVVRRGLLRHFGETTKNSSTVKSVKALRPNLRFAFSKEQLQALCGKKLHTINRKGKYLIFAFENQAMLSHLGMTGQWRVDLPGIRRAGGGEGEVLDHA